MNSKQSQLKTPYDEDFAMDKLKIHVYWKQELPSELKEQIPPLMQDMEWIGVILPPGNLKKFSVQLSIDPPDYIKELWVIATFQRKILGYCTGRWLTKYENTNRLELHEIYVVENFRRKGIAKKLLTLLLGKIPKDLTIMDFWAIDETAGRYFMENVLEKTPGYTIRQSVAKIAKSDLSGPAEKARVTKQMAKEKGYEVIYIENADFDHHVNLKEFIAAKDSINADMPLEDLSLGKPEISEQRFRESCIRWKKYGFRFLTYVVLRKGMIVGITEVMINKYHKKVAWQGTTGIVSSHRGNQLGLMVKSQMLAKLVKETQVEYWFTDNAGTNKHMIKINDELGFKEWPRGFLYEKEIKNIQIK